MEIPKKTEQTSCLKHEKLKQWKLTTIKLAEEFDIMSVPMYHLEINFS
jgi:hypothetical protein